MQTFDQMTSVFVSTDKYYLYYCDLQDPQSTARKQRYKWWQLPQHVQIGGRKHSYPILQETKVCQELYSSQQQTKGTSQPNFFLSTEIMLLDEEVCEEKQNQAVDALFTLFIPKPRSGVRSRQDILGLHLSS